MPSYDLAAAVRRQRNPRRKSITLREIVAPQMEAQNLYAACYRPVVNLWSEASRRIIAEYERTLSQMTQDSPADVQAEIDAAGEAFNRLFLTLTPALRDWALKVESVVRGRWRGAVLSATGVDLQTLLGPADARDTLESYIAWNTDLIRDVSDQARKRISDRVFSGLTQRKPAREVAKEIREAVGMARDRSIRIASDQLSKVSASLADERRREAGLEVWAWHHSGKRHPRVEHQARDGLLYSDNPALVGKKVGGKVIHAPPERGQLPGQLPFCGCRSRGVLLLAPPE